MDLKSRTMAPSQVTVLQFSHYYLVMAVSTALVNCTDLMPINTSGYKTALCFSLALALIWSWVFYNTHKEKHKSMKKALVLWTMFIVAWLYLVFLDIKDSTGFYCINRRCPTSFWLIEMRTNKQIDEHPYDYYDHSPHPSPGEFYDENRDESIEKQRIVIVKTTTVAAKTTGDAKDATKGAAKPAATKSTAKKPATAKPATAKPATAKPAAKPAEKPAAKPAGKLINTESPEYMEPETMPKLSATRVYRNEWLVKDFTKYLTSVVCVASLLVLFGRSWILLRRGANDIRNRDLCSHCYGSKQLISNCDKSKINTC